MWQARIDFEILKLDAKVYEGNQAGRKTILSATVFFVCVGAPYFQDTLISLLASLPEIKTYIHFTTYSETSFPAHLFVIYFYRLRSYTIATF